MKLLDLFETVVSDSDLKMLEAYLDKLFNIIGIDVEFSRHFMDRVNDSRNGKPITMKELVDLFKKEYLKYGKTFNKVSGDAEAVMRDMNTDINVPFVLELDQRNKTVDLIAKTVMRKRDFKTPNPVYKV